MQKRITHPHLPAKEPSPIKQAHLRSKVWKLTGPALIELSLVMLIQMVDMIQVGTLGPWAIASVGLANQPILLVLAIFIGLGTGATALVARLTGAGEDQSKVSAVVLQALAVTVAASAVFTVAGFFLAPWVARIMGARPDTLAPATVYFQIVIAGLIPTSATLILTAALRGAGDTRTPMIVNIIANVINIFGNWLLINGIWIFPPMEVAGAALATTLSRIAACLITLYLLLDGKHNIRLRLQGRFKFDWQIIGRLSRVGLPTAMEQLIMRLGHVVFIMIVASFGTTVMAAHQVALQVENFSYMPAMAFQIASTTLVGQALGAGDKKLAEKSGWEVLRWGLYLALFLSFFYFAFGRYVSMLFTRDSRVIEMGAGVLKIVAFAQPGLATHFILSGGLRGAGDTRYALFTTLIGIWTVRISLGYILGVYLGLGLTGAWIAMALDMCVRALLMFARYRAGRWKTMQV